MSGETSHKLKICVVDPGCLTPAYDSELCRALAQRGDDVILATAPYLNDVDFQFPRNVELSLAFFRGIFLPRHRRLRRVLKGLFYAPNLASLLKRLVRKEVDVIHIQWLMIPPLDNWWIRRIRRACPGAVVIVTIHDVKPLFRLTGKSFINRVLASVDGVIVHGESAKSELLTAMPELNASKVRVIPHGPLHQPEDTEAPQSGDAARDLLKLPKDRHIALFFGELKSYKGLDVLVSALQRLNGKDLERLVLVVAGKLEEPDCSAQLQDLERLSLETRLRIGYIPTCEVQTYFRAAHFVILPYKSITQSGILMTALANGRQVIASDVGELAQTIMQTAGGWLVPPQDAEALHDRLTQVLRTDPLILEQNGEAAGALLQDKFGWLQIAAETTTLYRDSLRAKATCDGLSRC